MPQDHLDQIRARLTKQDKQALRMSVGVEVDSPQLNLEVFAAYERLRAQARDARPKDPSTAGDKRGLQCSFCQKYVTEVTHIMKLSDAHVMCDLCIDLLANMVREGG